MKKSLFYLGLFLISAILSNNAFSHCEVPCGIFDDEVRAKLILEHVTTIEKAMKQIDKLSKDPQKNANQITRWVYNKEKHAVELQHIVTQYFMTQRIKPVDKSDAKAYQKYQSQLEQLHHMLFFAMKAKQSTDTGHIAKLKEIHAAFKKSYFTHKH